MEQLIPIFAQYGLTGIVLLCCGYYVYQHDRSCNEGHQLIREEHARERDAWRLLAADQHKEALSASGAITDALSQNAQALAELSTLLRDRR
ncbi:hypothetical protein KW797_00285 [Candidatus Parcubacteria bacterium]|nr:hypothetical protein [Candidatus Parcubacteria bacterium]